jgi:hypothetical protein
VEKFTGDIRMSDLIVGATTITMRANQKAVLLKNNTIKILTSPADSYRLATYDEMYADAGSPIRRAPGLYATMAALARATLP